MGEGGSDGGFDGEEAAPPEQLPPVLWTRAMHGGLVVQSPPVWPQDEATVHQPCGLLDGEPQAASPTPRPAETHAPSSHCASGEGRS